MIPLSFPDQLSLLHLSDDATSHSHCSPRTPAASYIVLKPGSDFLILFNGSTPHYSSHNMSLAYNLVSTYMCYIIHARIGYVAAGHAQGENK